MNKLVWLVLALGACKGGDKEPSGGTRTGKGGCETTAAAPADLVTSKTPGMLAPFEKLALGMAREEVATLCPNFFADKAAAKQGNFYVSEIVGKFGEDYAQARLEFVGDKLESIAYSLPAAIEAGLTAQWGAPKVSSGAKPGHAWFDEAAHVRAILGPPQYDGRRALEVSTYVPLEAFVEPEPTRIAWKPQDVLGKQPADLVKAFPQYKAAIETSAETKARTAEMMKDLDKEVAAMGIDTKRNANLPEFELPPSPFASDRATKILLHTNDDGSVRSYALWFRTASLTPEFGWPEQSAQLAKLLDETWGPSKQLDDTLGKVTNWFDAERGIRATLTLDKPEEADLAFSRYTPLATVWGPPGIVWGFENPERPLLGATPDEIVAAYKDHELKRDDKAGTLTLFMPPTDYEGPTSRMHVLMFVRNGKVAEFRFSLPYRSYPDAKAEYEAALRTKLGKPGAEKYGEVPYGKNTKVRWSDITKMLQITVEK